MYTTTTTTTTVAAITITMSSARNQKGTKSVQNVALRTRRESALLVLNRTLLISDNAILTLKWQYVKWSVQDQYCLVCAGDILRGYTTFTMLTIIAPTTYTHAPTPTLILPSILTLSLCQTKDQITTMSLTRWRVLMSEQMVDYYLQGGSISVVQLCVAAPSIGHQ